MTAGGRFVGPYQFPRTDSATGKRGPVLQRRAGLGPWGATVTLTTIEGGRPKLEIAAQWNRDRTSYSVAELQADPFVARRRFAMFCDELETGREPPL